MKEQDLERIVIENANGFTMANTRILEMGAKLYVLPCECLHVFYSKILVKVGWPYVLRYDPRWRPIKYIVPKEADIE